MGGRRNVSRAVRRSSGGGVYVLHAFKKTRVIAQQSANLTARAQVMRALQALERRRLDPSESGRTAWVSQPRMNDLLRGRLSKVSPDALVNLVSAAGRGVHVEIEAVE